MVVIFCVSGADYFLNMSWTLTMYLVRLTLMSCCQTILQKSASVDLRGPWLAMYLLSADAPCRTNVSVTTHTPPEVGEHAREEIGVCLSQCSCRCSSGRDLPMW